MISYLHFILIGLASTLVFSIYFYPKRRERIESTCVEESKLKTFMDEFITNLLITVPIYMVTFIVFTITDLF